MKGIRIMLTAVVLLGIVGGMLAFKAKKYSPDRYCYKTGRPGTCYGCFDMGMTTIPG